MQEQCGAGGASLYAESGKARVQVAVAGVGGGGQATEVGKRARVSRTPRQARQRHRKRRGELRAEDVTQVTATKQCVQASCAAGRAHLLSGRCPSQVVAGTRWQASPHAQARCGAGSRWTHPASRGARGWRGLVTATARAGPGSG
jgi:hypothetical protein